MTGISISQTKIGASVKEQNFFKMKVIAFNVSCLTLRKQPIYSIHDMLPKRNIAGR